MYRSVRMIQRGKSNDDFRVGQESCFRWSKWPKSNSPGLDVFATNGLALFLPRPGGAG